MKRRMSFLLLLAMPGIVFAQASQSTWSSVMTLKPGQKIQVDDLNAKKHTGVLMTVSDSAITLQESSGEKSVQKQEIHSIKLLDSSHRLKHTLLGAGIGAGAGAGVLAASWESHGFLGGRGVGATVGLAIGGVTGATVGSLLPTHNTVYLIH